MKKFLLAAALSVAAVLSSGGSAAQAQFSGACINNSTAFLAQPNGFWHNSSSWEYEWEQDCSQGSYVDVTIQECPQNCSAYQTIGGPWSYLTTAVQNWTPWIKDDTQTGLGGCNALSNYRARLRFVDADGFNSTKYVYTGIHAC